MGTSSLPKSHIYSSGTSGPGEPVHELPHWSLNWVPSTLAHVEVQIVHGTMAVPMPLAGLRRPYYVRHPAMHITRSEPGQGGEGERCHLSAGLPQGVA